MDDDLWERIARLEEDLLDEEEEYEEAIPVRPRFGRKKDKRDISAIYADEVYASPKEKPGKPPVRRDIRGLKVLLLFEIIGILVIIGWWLQWLI